MARTDAETPRGRALRTQHGAESLAARLPPLLVAAERVAATVAQGVHGRRRVGSGETFWQFRRYAAGDSTQRIDWRQSAKGRHVFVRENEWEAAQSVWLWRDASPSMAWRSAPDLPTKRERADLLTLAVAVLLVRGGERFALMGSGRPPAGNAVALNRAALDLIAAPDGDAVTSGAGQGGGLPPDLPLPRHASVLLVGDFLSPLASVNEAVGAMARRGVRGHLLQVLDPAEETLPFGGRVEFEGLEGEGDVMVPRVEAVRTAYQEKLAAHRAGLESIARAAGWTFLTHRTDRPPQATLLALWGALAMEPV
ncbi:MAG TPA: DUF58 domain-containing protein [Azospirillaceae bacterium]|nr:DUF58 domain-containing protein [Azospirillaceae bacterium]